MACSLEKQTDGNGVVMGHIIACILAVMIHQKMLKKSLITAHMIGAALKKLPRLAFCRAGL